MRSGQLGLAIMLTATVAAGWLVNATDGPQFSSGRHTVLTGEQGSDLTIEPFVALVGEATSSTAVIDSDTEIPTHGQFIVIDLAYSTTDRWAMPAEPELLDDSGREFSPARVGTVTWRAGPDLWFQGDLVFEIPADAPEPYTLVFRPRSPHAELPSVVAHIPLRLEASQDPVEVERARFEPGGPR